MKSKVSQTLAVASLAVLTACGGGGGGISSPVPNQGAAPQLKGNVAFTITIPAKSASSQSRSAKYITSSVQGVGISVTPAAPSVPTPTPLPSSSPMPPGAGGFNFYPLGASQPYCTSSSAGLTCTLALQAPAGNDLFTVTTYDKPYYGNTVYVNAVSTGTLTAQINAGVNNTINVVTHGVAQWGIVGITNPAPLPNAATTTPVAVNLIDGDGNVIIGTFDAPVGIIAVDSTGLIVPSISFSKQSFTQNSDASGLTMSWTGTAIPNGGTAVVYLQSTSPVLGTLTGSVIGSPTNPKISEGNSFTPGNPAAVGAPASLYFAHANSAAQTVTMTAANSTAAPTLGLGSCTGSVTISGSGAGPYTITPVAATLPMNGGNCDLQALLGGGASTNIPVMVSP